MKDFVVSFVACAIAKNFVSEKLSLHLKVRVGLQYCDVLENSVLAEELKKVLSSAAVAPQDDQNHGNGITSLVLRVGNALSYAPSRMTPRSVNQIRLGRLYVGNDSGAGFFPCNIVDASPYDIFSHFKCYICVSAR